MTCWDLTLPILKIGYSIHCSTMDRISCHTSWRWIIADPIFLDDTECIIQCQQATLRWSPDNGFGSVCGVPSNWKFVRSRDLCSQIDVGNHTGWGAMNRVVGNDVTITIDANFDDNNRCKFCIQLMAKYERSTRDCRILWDIIGTGCIVQQDWCTGSPIDDEMWLWIRSVDDWPCENFGMRIVPVPGTPNTTATNI